MPASSRRNIPWMIGLVMMTAACVVFIILFVRQINEYDAVRADYEKEREAMTAELDARDNKIKELTDTANYLYQENADLSYKMHFEDIINNSDVMIIGRALPLDLLDTVFSYYKSIDEMDFELYKTLIVPEGSEFREQMLNSYEAEIALGNQKIKSVMLFNGTPEHIKDINDPAYEGPVTLTVEMESAYGQYLYLQKLNGKWYVYAWD